LIGIKEKEDEDLQSLYTPGNRQERMRIEAFFFFSVRDPSEPFPDAPQRRSTKEECGTASYGWLARDVVIGGEGSGGGEVVEKDGVLRFRVGREKGEAVKVDLGG
jgi:hypothetical protein